jgi:hypothetical protein
VNIGMADKDLSACERDIATTFPGEDGRAHMAAAIANDEADEAAIDAQITVEHARAIREEHNEGGRNDDSNS